MIIPNFLAIGVLHTFFSRQLNLPFKLQLSSRGMVDHDLSVRMRESTIGQVPGDWEGPRVKFKTSWTTAHFAPNALQECIVSQGWVPQPPANINGMRRWILLKRDLRPSWFHGSWGREISGSARHQAIDLDPSDCQLRQSAVLDRWHLENFCRGAVQGDDIPTSPVSSDAAAVRRLAEGSICGWRWGRLWLWSWVAVSHGHGNHIFPKFNWLMWWTYQDETSSYF